jgi:hypothetical protein
VLGWQPASKQPQQLQQQQLLLYLQCGGMCLADMHLQGKMPLLQQQQAPE